MLISTWNVNSIKARLPNTIKWLKLVNPDILLLQETKTIDSTFPKLELEELGYNIAIYGQKSYNGVAILSKFPIHDIIYGIPGFTEDEQARYIECYTSNLCIASIYAPNGNPSPGPKYEYKLNWLSALEEHAKTLLKNRDPVILGGDFNIIPESEDCYDPVAWADDALFKKESRMAFRKIINLGYTEAFRAINNETGRYTFWDYQKGRFQRDEGIRIDHFLLSPEATDKLEFCKIDKTPRSWVKPSDHTPVLCKIT